MFWVISQKLSDASDYIEDFYINMLSDDWEKIDQLMIDFENQSQKIVYTNTQQLFYKLNDVVLKDTDKILFNCQESQINDDAKKIIEFILYYIREGKLIKDYNAKLNSIKKEFKGSEYDSFIKDFLPKKKIKAAWSFAFGSGMIFTTDDLSIFFSNSVSYNMGMDININKLFTSLYLNGSGLKLQIPFSAVSYFDTLNFEKNESFNYLDAGLKTGYFLIRNNSFHVAPYVSISGSFLMSNRYCNSEDSDLEYEVFNSFTYGAGLHTEVKILDFKYPNAYDVGPSAGYFSIKFEGGYSEIVKFKDTYAKGNTLYFICALVLGYGQF